jgi:hypothetical protein
MADDALRRPPALNLNAPRVLLTSLEEDRMPDDKSQGIIRGGKGQEQPADKERAQHVTSVEDTKKTEEEIRKTAEKSGF